jgi:hypothetical protein
MTHSEKPIEKTITQGAVTAVISHPEKQGPRLVTLRHKDDDGTAELRFDETAATAFRNVIHAVDQFLYERGLKESHALSRAERIQLPDSHEPCIAVPISGLDWHVSQVRRAVAVFRRDWKHAETIYLPPVAWGTHWGWHPTDTGLIFVRGAPAHVTSSRTHVEESPRCAVTSDQQTDDQAREPAPVGQTPSPYRFILQIDDNPPHEVELKQTHGTSQFADAPAPAVPAPILQQLRRIIDRYIDDEAAEYAETSPREDAEGHIYTALCTVNRWLRTLGA